ncbi:MAG: hypothetical protein G01um101425_678 [Candidatus Peregrinibacteria bacterium Gr01-1014_25]|nr:MAG: hypothetical protein G01um101425_678 [Candidatus Peregrinibacteria bacterium Gr01-1014_25]
MQLPRSPLWRIASQRNPSREARLLFQHNPPPHAGGHAEDHEEAEHEEGGAEDAAHVGHGQRQYRQRTQSLLVNKDDESPEKKRSQKAEDVLKKVEEVNDTFREVRDVLHSESVQKFVQGASAQERSSLATIERDLVKQRSYLGSWMVIARDIQSWYAGLMHPEAFVASMKVAYKDERGGQEIVQELERLLHTHADAIAHWDSISESDAQQIVDAFHSAARLETKLADVKEKMALYKEAFNEQRKLLEVLHKDHAQQELDAQVEAEQGGGHGMGIRGVIGKFFDKLGVTFWTPLEIWEAIKAIKEAYTKAITEKSQLKSAVLAKSIAGALKWAPYGDGVEVTLESDLESKHGKVAKEFQEHLSHENLTWKQIFDGGGILDDLINLGERDKAVGVLQYAAERGWLYDIDDCVAKEGGAKTIFGRSFADICPQDWSPAHINNFYTQLRGKNMTGVNEEIEKGTKRVQGIENTPFFIEEIDRELNDINLWAAVGIATRAIDRGLRGEVSPWITTTVLHHLRTNPRVRKFANVVFIDKLGKLAAYRSASTLGALQDDRPGMEGWLRSGADVQFAPVIGKTVHMIEQEILQNCTKKPDAKDLNHAVALVLACIPLTEKSAREKGIKLQLKPNAAITIFSDRYLPYRNSNHFKDLNAAVPGIAKEDTDYMTQITDNQLVGKQVIEDIFSGNGRGGFTHIDRVPDFAGNILKQYNLLDTLGKTTEAENFRREMGQKLTKALTISALNDQRTSAMYLIELRQFNAGKPMLKTLIEEGFFDIEPIVTTYVRRDAAETLARNILNQIDSRLFERLDAARRANNENAYPGLVQEFRGKMRRQPNWQTDDTSATPRRRQGGGAGAGQQQVLAA